MKKHLPFEIVKIIVKYYELNWRCEHIHKVYLISGGTPKQRFKQVDDLVDCERIAMWGQLTNKEEKIVFFTHEFFDPPLTWTELRSKIRHYGDNSVEHPFYPNWFEPMKRRFAIINIPEQSKKKRRLNL